MNPQFLDLVEVIEIHRDQIDRYGGAPGIRDRNLLESAVAMPQAGSRGEYFHSFPFEMAAAYLYHLVRNHAFVYGNKRVGVAAALVFLELNGVRTRFSNEELEDLALEVARGRRTKAEIAACLGSHARGR